MFTCYPNDLSSCPRRFTKLMKVPLSTLHQANHIIMGYIDDFHLQGYNFHECWTTILEASLLFTHLGFVIHPEKSCLVPSQYIEFLGFVIDSRTMKVTLTDVKKEQLKDMITHLLQTNTCKIRQVACVIGKLVSSLPEIPSTLHYEVVHERIKIQDFLSFHF